MSFNRILIAVDESAVAAHAVGVGIELAKMLNAELAFIHVVDTSFSHGAPKIEIPADHLIARQSRKPGFCFRHFGSAREPALRRSNSLKSESLPPRSSREQRAGPLTSS